MKTWSRPKIRPINDYKLNLTVERDIIVARNKVNIFSGSRNLVKIELDFTQTALIKELFNATQTLYAPGSKQRKDFQALYMDILIQVKNQMV